MSQPVPSPCGEASGHGRPVMAVTMRFSRPFSLVSVVKVQPRRRRHQVPRALPRPLIPYPGRLHFRRFVRQSRRCIAHIELAGDHVIDQSRAIFAKKTDVSLSNSDRSIKCCRVGFDTNQFVLSAYVASDETVRMIEKMSNGTLLIERRDRKKNALDGIMRETVTSDAICGNVVLHRDSSTLECAKQVIADQQRYVGPQSCQVIAANEVGRAVFDECWNTDVIPRFGVLSDKHVAGLKPESGLSLPAWRLHA